MTRSSLEYPFLKLQITPPDRGPAPGRLFEEPGTWRFLEQTVLPQLLASKQGRPIRVWCAGPGAGEEAYSVVLLIADLLGPATLAHHLKVFATGDDELASPFQTGKCLVEALANVPAKHRREYFHRVDGHFALHPALRDVIFFGRHNLVTDAPLARLDLVFCPNALSGRDPWAERLTLKRLSYALSDGGYLILGRRNREIAGDSPHLTEIEPGLGVFRKTSPCSARSLMPLLALRPQAEGIGVDFARDLSATMGSDQACGQLLLDTAGTVLMIDHPAWQTLELDPRDHDSAQTALALPLQIRVAAKTVLTTATPRFLENVEWPTGAGETSRFDIEIVPTRAPEGEPAGAIVRLHRPEWRRAVAFRARAACQPFEIAAEILHASEEETRAACDELEQANERLQALTERLADANAALLSERRSLGSQCAELTAILHALPHAMLATTPAGIIVACSAAAASRFGSPVERMTGQQLSRFLEARAPDGAAGVSADVEQLCAGEGAIGRRVDGATFAVMVELTRTAIGSTTLFVLTLGESIQGRLLDGDDGAVGRLAELTARERDVLRLLVAGRQSKEIAYELGISRRTVDIHRGRLMRKMQARSIADLIRQAIAGDLTDPN